MSVKSTIAILVSALLLSACMVQSKVQGRYVEDQGNCRDSAEGNIGAYEKPGMTTKDRNAQLVTLFANCMAKQGWQVAKPKRTTTTGPHGPLDPYGSSAKTATTTTTTTTTAAGAAAAAPVTVATAATPPAGELTPAASEQVAGETAANAEPGDPAWIKRPLERVGAGANDAYFVDDRSEININIHSYRMVFVVNKDAVFYKKNAFRQARKVCSVRSPLPIRRF